MMSGDIWRERGWMDGWRSIRTSSSSSTDEVMNTEKPARDEFYTATKEFEF